MSASAVERRRLPRTAPIAWALVAWCVACLLFGLVVLAGSLSVPVPDTFWGFRGQEAIIAGATAFVGGVLALKRPKNGVSWLILGSGAAGALQFAGGEYAIAALAAPAPGAAVAAWLDAIMWIPSTAFLFATGLLFPNGVLLSPRWRYAVIAVALGSAATFSFYALFPGPLQQLPYENPFGLTVPRETFAAATPIVRTLFALGAIAVVISLVLRYRVSGGEVRQQLKWLVVAGSFAAITQFLAVIYSMKALELLAAVGIVAFLVSMALAVLRYRLYDIDIIINRTVVYAATTATLVATYALVALVAQALLHPFTQGSEIAIAASTLAVAALIQPLRRRIQTAVDRRFYRARYDAVRTVDALAVRMRDEVDIDAVRAELLNAACETMQPAHASIWLRGGR